VPLVYLLLAHLLPVHLLRPDLHLPPVVGKLVRHPVCSSAESYCLISLGSFPFQTPFLSGAQSWTSFLSSAQTQSMKRLEQRDNILVPGFARRKLTLLAVICWRI
jgi:hypothetical protein